MVLWQAVQVYIHVHNYTCTLARSNLYCKASLKPLSGTAFIIHVPSCSECPAGTYSDSVSNSPCQSCPDNSEATQTGLSECPGVQNYYRVPDEGAGEPCTRELWTVYT